MPSISNLSASNSSFILTYGNYTDFWVFVTIIGASIALLLISQFINKREETGRLLLSVLAVVFAISAVWMSLGIAHFGFTNSAGVTNNSSLNESIQYNYIHPVEQTVNSPALTIICAILAIFSGLNALNIFLEIIQGQPTPVIQKTQVGDKNTKSGIMLDGKWRKNL